MNINTTLNIRNRIIEISALELILIDDSLSKTVSCRFILVDKNNRPLPPQFSIRATPLVLWSKDQYDAIGDWTQSQAEARVLELLGDNVKEGLEKLLPSK